MTRLAAMDVGTNSVRLLVAEAGHPLRPLERLMQVTRLGEGIDASGRFDDRALERTLACIAGFARRAEELGASRITVSATSAARDAADRARFFSGVRERVGVEAEVLSGAEEAATAFLGAVTSVDGEAPYCVLDIGGGSTELIVGRTAVEGATSRQLGCVRLTERALHSDPPTAAELEVATALADAELTAATADVDRQLAAAGAGTGVTGARTFVGVAGTVTTLAALYRGLATYEPERIHGTRIPLGEVRALTAALAGMTSAARGRLGPMAPGREDVIVGGALILQRAMELYGFEEVLASEADLLDGLVVRMLDGAGGTVRSPSPG